MTLYQKICNGPKVYVYTAVLCIPLHHNDVTCHDQVIPLPETESAALRQAFIDHGQTVGIQLSDVPRDTPITEVRTRLRTGSIVFWMDIIYYDNACSVGSSRGAILHG